MASHFPYGIFMSYETAPQTEVLATNCAICARPLCDAVSVETGMGPVCREKYGYYADVAPEARERANRIVWEIAVAQRAEPEQLSELEKLGFTALVNKLCADLLKVEIEETAGGYLVKTPYKEDALAAWRRVPGRRFDRETKRNFVPAKAKVELWDLLMTHYRGHTARGPKGLFVIP